MCSYTQRRFSDDSNYIIQFSIGIKKFSANFAGGEKNWKLIMKNPQDGFQLTEQKFCNLSDFIRTCNVIINLYGTNI